jgi:hypothetical protein
VLPPGFFADFLWSNVYKGDKKFYLLKKLPIHYQRPNHTMTIEVCIIYTGRDLSLKLIIWVVALVSDRNGPCRGCLLIYRSLFYYYSDFYGFSLKENCVGISGRKRSGSQAGGGYGCRSCARLAAALPPPPLHTRQLTTPYLPSIHQGFGQNCSQTYGQSRLCVGGSRNYESS